MITTDSYIYNFTHIYIECLLLFRHCLKLCLGLVVNTE